MRLSGGAYAFCAEDGGRRPGFADDQYAKAGATLLDTADEVWKAGDMIVKVKEPVAPEYPRMRENQLLVHLPALSAGARIKTDARPQGHGRCI